jgi:hypothetical protein
MDREINLNSIRALEEQIQEHERAIIKLKRARNSLLNVSTLLPPEILGSIFRWNVIPDGDFGGLSAASHNFLLVCHHWFQVASGTPELWGFWGNLIQDWARLHARCRTAPLDLILVRDTSPDFDDTMRDVLQDRATQDTIRRVHLEGTSAELLNSVISSIITKEEGTRSSSVESFMLWNVSPSRVDISDFFLRYHFPKLQRLDLFECNISSWDLLRSRISSLTTLSLATIYNPPFPTLSQILSILSANPNLQSLKLTGELAPDVDDDRSSSHIQLRRLKTLHLKDSHRRVFGLLDRLELPDKMDKLQLSLSRCPPSDLQQYIGPYLRNCIRRRSPGGLRLLIHPGCHLLNIMVGDACESYLDRGDWFVVVSWDTGGTLGPEVIRGFCFDIAAHIPLEEVVQLNAVGLPILRSEQPCARMYNLTHLCFDGADLSTWFVEPDIYEPHVFKNLLPELRFLTISWPRPSGGDWSPLTNFLTRRAAVGNRIYSLRLVAYPHIDEDVLENIRRAVEVFEDGGIYDR